MWSLTSSNLQCGGKKLSIKQQNIRYPHYFTLENTPISLQYSSVLNLTVLHTIVSSCSLAILYCAHLLFIFSLDCYIHGLKFCVTIAFVYNYAQEPLFRAPAGRISLYQSFIVLLLVAMFKVTASGGCFLFCSFVTLLKCFNNWIHRRLPRTTTHQPVVINSFC